MPRATVLLADDHPVVAEGLAGLLRGEFDVVGTVNDGGQLLETARRVRPDVIVTDFTMPAMSGLDALRRLRADGVASKVIVLTVHADVELAAETLRAGASAFIVKEAVVSELVSAIRAVLRGKTYVTPELAPDVMTTLAEAAASPSREKLTPRQREVVRLLADGRTMKEVAAVLGMSSRTAEAHKYQSMRALGFTTTAELIRYAIEHGLTSRPAVPSLAAEAAHDGPPQVIKLAVPVVVSYHRVSCPAIVGGRCSENASGSSSSPAKRPSGSASARAPSALGCRSFTSAEPPGSDSGDWHGVCRGRTRRG